jgi:hypothetical protein
VAGLGAKLTAQWRAIPNENRAYRFQASIRAHPKIFLSRIIDTLIPITYQYTPQLRMVLIRNSKGDTCV